MANLVFVHKGECPKCKIIGGLFRDINRKENRDRVYCRSCAGDSISRLMEEKSAEAEAMLVARVDRAELTEAEAAAIRDRAEGARRKRVIRGAQAWALLNIMAGKYGGAI